MLKDLGCKLDVELGIHDICRACVMEEVRSTCHLWHMPTALDADESLSQTGTKQRLDHDEIRKNFDKASKEAVNEGEGYLIPNLWLKGKYSESTLRSGLTISS